MVTLDAAQALLDRLLDETAAALAPARFTAEPARPARGPCLRTDGRAGSSQLLATRFAARDRDDPDDPAGPDDANGANGADVAALADQVAGSGATTAAVSAPTPARDSGTRFLRPRRRAASWCSALPRVA